MGSGEVFSDQKMVSRRAFIGSVVGSAVLAGVGGYFTGSSQTAVTASVDPVLGFTGLTAQTPPPTRPDYEVELAIRPRPPLPIPEFYFEPTGLFIKPGQTVKFNASTPHHTVTAFHPLHGRTQRVPEGVPAFTSPVLPVGTYWLYTFQKEGVYDLFCGPHEYFGMAMRIVAGVPDGPGMSTVPPPFPLPEEGALLPPLLTGALVLRDLALEPGNIITKGAVKWGDLETDSKRLLLAPTSS